MKDLVAKELLSKLTRLERVDIINEIVKNGFIDRSITAKSFCKQWYNEQGITEEKNPTIMEKFNNRQRPSLADFAWGYFKKLCLKNNITINEKEEFDKNKYKTDYGRLDKQNSIRSIESDIQFLKFYLKQSKEQDELINDRNKEFGFYFKKDFGLRPSDKLDKIERQVKISVNELRQLGNPQVISIANRLESSFSNILSSGTYSTKKDKGIKDLEDKSINQAFPGISFPENEKYSQFKRRLKLLIEQEYQVYNAKIKIVRIQQAIDRIDFGRINLNEIENNDDKEINSQFNKAKWEKNSQFNQLFNMIFIILYPGEHNTEKFSSFRIKNAFYFTEILPKVEDYENYDLAQKKIYDGIEEDYDVITKKINNKVKLWGFKDTSFFATRRTQKVIKKTEDEDIDPREARQTDLSPEKRTLFLKPSAIKHFIELINNKTMGLSPKEMEDAIIKNLRDRTGKSLNEWLKVLSEENLSDKKEMKSCLKEKYNLGHFQAQTIVKLFQEKS